MSEKTYRVLAVDDEYWSRESLRTLLSWQDYGLEMLEPACDGEEVLERMEADRPDIILTDIDMPFMDGLTLMKRLASDYPEVICIAVSGYDDFDKVKGFFKSGGIDYLLKPVSKEELVKALAKALQDLEERQQKAAKEGDSDLVSSFLEDHEYSSLLNKKLYGGKDASHVGGSNLFSEVTVVLFKFHDAFRIAASYGHEMAKLSVFLKGCLRSLLPEEDGSDLLGRKGASARPIVFNYTTKMSEFLLVGSFSTAWLDGLGEMAEKCFPLPAYGPVTVVVHSRSASLDDLGVLYREMMAALATRPFSRSFQCLSCKVKGTPPAFVEHLDHRLEGEMMRYMEGGNWAGVKKTLFDRAAFSECLSGKWSILETDQFLARVTGCLDEAIRKNYRDSYASLEDALETIDLAKRQLDPYLAVSTLGDFLDSMAGEEKVTYAAAAPDQLLQVRSYLEDHYGESISLPLLAQEFHMDPNYLSRCFSQRFGETITASLTKIRITHAIELMHEPNRKLESISFLVGYDDYNYFSRVFRKKVGRALVSIERPCC